MAKAQYLDGTLDEQMTWTALEQFLFRRCPYCKADVKCQEIQQFNPIFNDGQVWCTHCDSYLGMWDVKEGVVSRSDL